MKVYQTDFDGFYVGETLAQESPLEPGVFLIPGGAFEAKPPALSGGERARMVSGSWVTVSPDPTPTPDPLPTPAEALATERAGMIVSRFQAKAALMAAGHLPAVETVIAAADAITQLAWAEAVEMRRTSPMIAGLAGAVGLSDTDLDDLFRAAALIEA